MTIKLKKMIVICEGPSEFQFFTQCLKKYLQSSSLAHYDIQIQIIGQLTRTDRKGGGGINLDQLVEHIKELIKQDKTNQQATFVTFFDYYQLSDDFIQTLNNTNVVDVYERIEQIEQYVHKTVINLFNETDYQINTEQLMIYIQLHEFEMLYYANLDLFCQSAPSPQRQKYLQENIRPFLEADLVSSNDNPEAINNGEDTAPSKRIIKNYKKFAQLKVGFARGFGAQCIKNEFAGVEWIREKCPHFNAWLETLQRLGQ